MFMDLITKRRSIRRFTTDEVEAREAAARNEKLAAIGELAAALAKAQGEMTVAYNDGKNPHFRSTYATLASIHQAAVGPLARNGLAVVQAPGLVDGTVTLTTRLIHSSGQWMECQMAAASKNMGPQAIGSTVTYLRRGGLAAMVGVVSGPTLAMIGSA